MCSIFQSDPNEEEATTSEPVIKFDSRCTEPQPVTPVLDILAKYDQTPSLFLYSNCAWSYHKK